MNTEQFSIRSEKKNKKIRKHWRYQKIAIWRFGGLVSVRKTQVWLVDISESSCMLCCCCDHFTNVNKFDDGYDNAIDSYLNTRATY